MGRDEETFLPRIVDLQIEETYCSHGYRSEFICQLEKTAAETGSIQLYMAVDPVDNPDANALYLRLGYQPLQLKPYRKFWQFADSRGNLHRGEDWIVDLVKELGERS